MKLSRRTLLQGAVAAAPLPARQAAAAQRPNVIVILFDDLGVHDLGFLGANDLRTPHIDRLASSGTVCRNWYSNAPVCAPARSALMTGRNPLRAGVPDNGRALRPTEKTIASLLKENGYETGLIGKWHLGSSAPIRFRMPMDSIIFTASTKAASITTHTAYYWGEPKRANFHDLWRNRQEIFEDGRYLTERIGEEAAAFIDRQRERPFFLYTAFNAVHYPMHAPQQYLERFPNLPPERRMYAAMLAAADDRIGDMVAALERTGQRDRTLIFLIGDNGATTERRAGLNQEIATAGRNTPFRGFKFSAFDGGMHVPALVNWPGHIPAGRRIDQIVMTADILPTVVSLAGAKLPSDRTFDGRNIWPVLTENAPSPNPYVAWAQGPQLAIRKGKWKLVLNGVTHDGTPAGQKPLEGEDAVFLSDLDQDPGESRNLRRQHPEIVDELQTLLSEWRAGAESN